jgi:hypothetical protein
MLYAFSVSPLRSRNPVEWRQAYSTVRLTLFNRYAPCALRSAILYLPDQIGQVFHDNRLPWTHKDTDIAVPAIIPMAHIGVPASTEMENIHRAHVDTGSAFVAFLPIDL